MTTVTKDERFGVEIYLTGRDAKQIVASLLTDKEMIELGLGFRFEWMKLPSRTVNRIACFYLDACIQEENRWDEYQVWLVKRLVAMESVFRPIARTMLEESATTKEPLTTAYKHGRRYDEKLFRKII